MTWPGLGEMYRKPVEGDVKRKFDMLSVQIAQVLRKRIEFGGFQAVFLLCPAGNISHTVLVALDVSLHKKRFLIG